MLLLLLLYLLLFLLYLLFLFLLVPLVPIVLMRYIPSLLIWNANTNLPLWNLDNVQWHQSIQIHTQPHDACFRAYYTLHASHTLTLTHTYTLTLTHIMHVYLWITVSLGKLDTYSNDTRHYHTHSHNTQKSYTSLSFSLLPYKETPTRCMSNSTLYLSMVATDTPFRESVLCKIKINKNKH